MQKKTSYEEFKEGFQSPYYLCGKLGEFYNNEEELIHRILCNNWGCGECRPFLKNQLFLEVVKNVYCFELDKHFIITFQGKEKRKEISWDESYKFMNKQWVNLRKAIEWKYGKISYILFPRAQDDGYCHYHILTNKFISWNWLNEKRKNYDFGFTSIQKNKNVADYLKKDYWNDHEWIIPSGIKRFRTSRDIVLRNWADGNLGYYKNNIIRFQNSKKKLNKREKEELINQKFGKKIDWDKIKDISIILEKKYKSPRINLEKKIKNEKEDEEFTLSLYKNPAFIKLISKKPLIS